MKTDKAPYCTTMLLIYNEKGNIRPLVSKILTVYVKNRIDGEILLIDDGSTDGSREITEELAEKHGNVRVIRHEVNRGRSQAILTGFRNARGKFTMLMDGDGQYDPREIPRFLKRSKEGWDLVSGRRKNRTDNWIRRFISKVYNRLIIGKGFGLDIEDQNSGFKSFRTKKALKMDFEPGGFYGLHRFILPLAHLKGLSVTEIPIDHLPRKKGKSYIKFYTVPFITLIDYVRFRRKYGNKKGR